MSFGRKSPKDKINDFSLILPDIIQPKKQHRVAITNSWLTADSTSQSYERGDDIREDQDIDIIKTGNVYTADVYGTEIYEVKIIDDGNTPKSYCSCPYDWGGLCKHIIAVGLEILEERYKEREGADDIDRAKNYLLLYNEDFYQNVFSKASVIQQRDFLRQLFQRDRDLREAFLNFLDTVE